MKTTTTTVKMPAEVEVTTCRENWDGVEQVSYSCRITVLGIEVGRSHFGVHYKSEAAAVRAAKRDMRQNNF